MRSSWRTWRVNFKLDVSRGERCGGRRERGNAGSGWSSPGFMYLPNGHAFSGQRPSATMIRGSDRFWSRGRTMTGGEFV